MSSKQDLEGLLFVSGEVGISLANLADLTGFSKPAIRNMLDELSHEYQSNQDSALQIIESNETYRLTTKKELSSLLGKYFEQPLQSSLSPASLEILSIIAYKQPITRVEIDSIRGVQSGATIQNLVARDLVCEVGRLDEPGRPKTYGTTSDFLDYFGITDLKELPDLPQIKTTDENNDSTGDLFLKEFNQSAVITEKDGEQDE